MEKILYVTIDESHMNSSEAGFFQAFVSTCLQEGFFIAKKTDVEEEKRHGLFCVAVCDTQEDIDFFAAQNIPVVAYEREISVRLNNPYIILSFEAVDGDYLTKVHHRFFGLPLTIMETKRTIIREFCMEDLDALFRLYEGEHITDYMEPLYEYEEEKAYEEMTEDLLGKDLLVAPVYEKGRSSRSEYLPNDAWVHLFTKKEYVGGTHVIDAPIGYPPVFVRKDSDRAKELLSVSNV